MKQIAKPNYRTERLRSCLSWSSLEEAPGAAERLKQRTVVITPRSVPKLRGTTL